MAEGLDLLKIEVKFIYTFWTAIAKNGGGFFSSQYRGKQRYNFIHTIWTARAKNGGGVLSSQYRSVFILFGLKWQRVILNIDVFILFGQLGPKMAEGKQAKLLSQHVEQFRFSEKN